MRDNRNKASLLFYFFTSLLALTIAGLLFKVLFVLYGAAQFSALPSSDIVYALFWGLRFDLASAALLSLLSCFVLWFFYRLLPAKDPALFLLGFMLLLQMSAQLAG